MTNRKLAEAWKREVEACPPVVQEIFDEALDEARKVLGQHQKGAVKTRIKNATETKIPEGADICAELIAWCCLGYHRRISRYLSQTP